MSMKRGGSRKRRSNLAKLSIGSARRSARNFARSSVRVACAYFASRGLVCATAEYEMLGKAAAHPAAGESKKRVCVTDAKSAIRWFKQHAEELGVDPRVALKRLAMLVKDGVLSVAAPHTTKKATRYRYLKGLDE